MRRFVPSAAGALALAAAPAAAFLAAFLAALVAAGPAAAETQQVQDWKVTCRNGGCTAHYDGQGVQMLIGRSSEDGNRRIALRLSPNSTRGEPVTIRLDSGWQAGLVVGVCDETACQAAVAPSQQATVENAFARARGGLVAYKAGNRIVMAPISLMGFSAANGMVR